MNYKTKHLIKKREETEEKIDELQDQVFDLTREMCDIEGNCPLCLNTHYPHCLNGLKHKRPITEGHIKGEIKGGKSDISSRPNPPPPIRR